MEPGAGAELSPFPDPRGVHRLRRRVLAWYRREGRPLEIRASRDPYAVLVAEVMAQQTQIARVAPAWRAFLARYPTIADLAAATPADVIRTWGGLGYNRRAVHLRLAAIAMVELHRGRVPRDVEALQALPGIGPYTARAVAATAFRRPVAPVDTNVRRVVGRITAGHGHPDDGQAVVSRAALQAAADLLVARTRPDAWTHALMDLGASVCRRRPRCAACPALDACSYARMRIGIPAPGRASRRLTRAESAPHARQPRRGFASTSRWLRGRLLMGLRDAADGEWIRAPSRVGTHGPEAVELALRALARDGLVERHRDGRVRLPLGEAAVPVPAAAASGRP